MYPPRLPQQNSTMTDEEMAGYLTRSLAELKNIKPGISLRMWYDVSGQLSFFFTNLPPRNRRPRIEEITKATTESGEGGEAPANPPPSVSEANLPSPERGEPPQDRRRGKRRKRVNTSTPEQIRFCSIAVSPQVSLLEQERDVTHPTIPCNNSFEVLTNLDTDECISLQQPHDEPQSEHSEEYECLSCEKMLQPITSNCYNLMCYIGKCCETEFDENAQRNRILKCMCRPGERFVCVHCVSSPDCVDLYQRIQSEP